MGNLVNLAMLACAIVGSMVFGILGAYAILRGCFTLMRPQERQIHVKAPQPETAGVA